MDQQKFVELLQGVQVPDTNRVKAATAELRKTYYPHPESLLWLLQILTSHDSSAIRQQAAVEALRLVPKHWTELPAGQKPAIRQKLVEATLNEDTVLVRHSTARVVASIASIDLEDGEWAELLPQLEQAAKSPQVKHREVGVYILFTLLDTAPEGFNEKNGAFFNLFRTTIQDAESKEVRINTMLALSRIAMNIDPDEDKSSLRAFQDLLPAMVGVLRTAIDEADDDRIMQAFEVFQTLLGCEPALLTKHFKDLVQFMLEIASETSVAEDTRSQALSFLMQCVKYRRMKIQGIKDMGEQLTTKAMQIVAEMDDDDDDEDEVTPSRSALGLLDLLATSLPPRQVIVPLLKSLPQYVNSENPAFRKAGILALGMCVEGAPDFIATQLSNIMPVVIRLLHDPDAQVRHAALHGVTRLADDLAEDMSKEHAQLIPGLIKNLQAAAAESTGEDNAKAIKMMVGACTALESLIDGMDQETIALYASDLVPNLLHLVSHPDYHVKAGSAGTIGAVAASSEEQFLPFFEPSMKALAEFVPIKDSEDELVLRAAVTDTMGRIAAAVGAQAFQPYVQDLMRASEEALHLGNPRLRETSYILWSTMAKLYEHEFVPFLDGVVKGLLESLEQEESELEVELGEEAEGLFGKDVVVAGKKIKVTQAGKDEIEDIDIENDGEGGDDWDDLTAVTAVALEKEISVEVIGDILTSTKAKFFPYLEKTIEAIGGLVDHNYEGVRKAAISTLWRAYASVWESTEQKWEAGLPLKQQPSPELLKLAEIVVAATLGLWADEVDRGVVTDINRNVAEVLKLAGPAILAHQNMLEQMISILGLLITRQHPCQMDLGDEFEDQEVGESSEYDWVVVDTALDVIVGLSKALGTQFGEVWKVFEKRVMKLASSQEAVERSTSTGAIGECIAHGWYEAVTPYTERLLTLLLHRLNDEDPDTKSNAAYGLGLLILHSTDSAKYLPKYTSILTKLGSLLAVDESRDNAAGCVSRMIIAHPDKVPIAEVLPALVKLLPLKKDYMENKPIYDCIVGLYQHQNATVQQLTGELLGVFAQVLAPPEEQLETETRQKVVELVRYLAKDHAAQMQGSEVLMGVLHG